MRHACAACGISIPVMYIQYITLVWNKWRNTLYLLLNWKTGLNKIKDIITIAHGVSGSWMNILSNQALVAELTCLFIYFVCTCASKILVHFIVLAYSYRIIISKIMFMLWLINSLQYSLVSVSSPLFLSFNIFVIDFFSNITVFTLVVCMQCIHRTSEYLLLG